MLTCKTFFDVFGRTIFRVLEPGLSPGPERMLLDCVRLGELSEQDKWSSVVPLTCDISDSSRLCTMGKAEYLLHDFASLYNVKVEEETTRMLLHQCEL